jgi:hypothetical protein
MATSTSLETDIDSLTLSPEEGRALFEREARRLVGMSGEAFLRRLDAGEYDNLDDVPENWNIMRLEMLISFARQES